MTYRNLSLTVFFAVGLPVFAASTTAPIENFHQIDQQVYRGAQPGAEGFQYLSKIGVKVVLDLREHDSRSAAEERAVTANGMRYVNVPMTGMTPPTDAEISKILGLLEDPAQGPVFVHCKRGADRTGAVIAAYRIDHDKWENARALSEAMGDRMSHWQFQRQAFIRTFKGNSTTTAAAVAATPAPANNN